MKILNKVHNVEELQRSQGHSHKHIIAKVANVARNCDRHIIQKTYGPENSHNIKHSEVIYQIEINPI